MALRTFSLFPWSFLFTAATLLLKECILAYRKTFPADTFFLIKNHNEFCKKKVYLISNISIIFCHSNDIIWMSVFQLLLSLVLIFSISLWQYTVHITNLFGNCLQKGKIFPFGKELIFPFQKNHPLSEDKKFKMSLCMSLVFGASRNVSFSNDNHILKFFTESFFF